MSVKELLIQHVLNLTGFKTSRKIVVFESDDWGSIRMPSKNAYQNLLNKGIRVDKSNYDRLDALENEADLTNLMEVLGRFKNRSGQPVVFTLNTVLTNPDFESIRKENYEVYRYEPFFESYRKYYGQDLEALWKEGRSAGVLRPQFHAREHLNTSLWMKDLREGNTATRFAFDQGFFGLKTMTSSVYQKHYLAAYWAENMEDMQDKSRISKHGLELFKSAFGFESRSMIACNYIWPSEIESDLRQYGIRYLQGQRAQITPSLTNGACVSRYHSTGQINDAGQYYLVRNCQFEPYANPGKDWVNSCLKEISNSFLWKTPAILSTHRINYVSRMDRSNRDHSLNQLSDLLRQILNKWPEVEFMSSDALGDLIHNR